MQKSSKKQKISRFDLRILDIMGVSDSCQTTCLLFTVKKTLWLLLRAHAARNFGYLRVAYKILSILKHSECIIIHTHGRYYPEKANRF